MKTSKQNKTYFGGKNGNGTYQNIINQIPPHETYIELFLGSGAILNNKLPAKHNFGIEIDTAVIDKFNYAEGAAIINCCAFDFLLRKHNLVNHKDTFIYVDPPYLKEVRKQKRNVYKYEFSKVKHIELLKTLKSLRARIAISTYESSLYEKILKGWRVHKFLSMTHNGMAMEYLYMNYPEPTSLHDYSFLGLDFTDRQRIKRKLQREINKLQRLPVLERKAILQAIFRTI